MATVITGAQSVDADRSALNKESVKLFISNPQLIAPAGVSVALEPRVRARPSRPVHKPAGREREA